MTFPGSSPSRLTCALAAAAIAAGPAAMPAAAATGQVWITREASHYGDARLDGVALSPEGRVSLAPAVERIAESSQPFLWCIARDARGRLYAGGGNEGKVIRVDGGRAEVVFDAPEVEVHAIAFDAQGRLYVGTSPDGKVYRKEAEGAPEVFFDPEATYIWALAFDGSGNMLVATGQPGRVLRVEPTGAARTLLDSREEHIRSLVPDGRSGFLAGSDGGGIIYGIDAGGATRVVFDSPEREIASLAVAGEHVFAAALAPTRKSGRGSSSSETQGSVTTVRVTAEGGSEEGDDEEPPPQPPQGQGGRGQQRPEEKFKGSIYRITDSGYARRIWESETRLPLALLASGDDGVLVGTDGGRILSLGAHGEVSEIAVLESGQVNALSGSGGEVYAATSNLGVIFRLTEGFARKGTILGGVRDAGYTARWGAITWDGSMPRGTEIFFEVRTGDTEEPDATWSAWSGPYGEPRGSVIRDDPARFLQWRATLLSEKGDASPTLHGVLIHYMPENMPPEVSSVEVLDPGVWLQSSGPERAPGGARGHQPSSPKRATEQGMRSVQWTSVDGNQDPLDAEVLFKAEDESVWRSLGAGIEESFFAWDSRAMPDGLYRVRVIVHDAPGNPQGHGLVGSRDSAVFDIDNTPPVVSGAEARVTSESAEIRARVTDSFSAVHEISCSLDAGAWVVVLPVDGMADATEESIRFATGELAPGEHSVVIRASDKAGNVSSGKVVFGIR